MSYFKNAFRCVAIALCMVSAFALLGCATPGKIGEVAEFDIAKASPDDIKKALDKDGKVVISGAHPPRDRQRQACAEPPRIWSGGFQKVMKKNPNLKISVVGHTDSTGDYNYKHPAVGAPGQGFYRRSHQGWRCSEPAYRGGRRAAEPGCDERHPRGASAEPARGARRDALTRGDSPDQENECDETSKDGYSPWYRNLPLASTAISAARF